MNQVLLGSDIDEVVISKIGTIGHIQLNRPEALNALTLDMIRQIAAALRGWEADKDIHAVVFTGAGGKAFCAGGDVKSFYNAGMESRRGQASSRVPIVFFSEEYSLNKQIFHYPKNTYALIDGICMGGGYGIAAHCDVRIASRKTVFAMPETAIGFFPDVGAMYHLVNCPHHYGRYLAMTGDHIDGEDMVALGLADFYAPQIDEKSFLEEFSKADKEDDRAELIMRGLPIQRARMPGNAGMIAKAFSSPNVFDVLSTLEEMGSADAADIFETLMMRSPTSVLVTSAYLQWLDAGGQNGERRSFDEVIAQDFILAQHFTTQQDLYEGIRAKIIDKDNKPKWLPDDLRAVAEEDVNTYFTATGYDLDDVEIF